MDNVRLTLIDDCVNVNCSGQGNCTDRVILDCDCFPGYTDAICQTDINEYDVVEIVVVLTW